MCVKVDNRDAHILEEYAWRIHHPYKGSKPYVSAKIWVEGKTVRVYLHRIITGFKSEIDHVNRDPLDNRRCNLRECTSSQNKMNSGLRVDNKSRTKGVSIKKGKYFVARAKKNGEEVYLGCFKKLEDAAMAYNKYVEKHYGAFASKNEVTQ
jgi:hypothetical protein